MKHGIDTLQYCASGKTSICYLYAYDHFPLRGLLAPPYPTMSAIADLSAWVKDSFSKPKCPLYTIYVDFTKAPFDSIDRSRLFAKLNDMGVSATFIKALWSIFKQNNFQVMLPNQSLSDPITQTLGVPKVIVCLHIYIHCIGLQQICLR